VTISGLLVTKKNRMVKTGYQTKLNVSLHSAYRRTIFNSVTYLYITIYTWKLLHGHLWQWPFLARAGGTGPQILIGSIGLVISLSRCCLPNDEGPGPTKYFFPRTATDLSNSKWCLLFFCNTVILFFCSNTTKLNKNWCTVYSSLFNIWLGKLELC